MKSVTHAHSGLSGTCNLLSSMYLCEPSKEAIDSWKIVVAGETSICLRELKDALEDIGTESEEVVESLISEYTRLFVGPYRLPCPPWESVYTSPKKLLMQEAAREVREIYNELGLTVDDPGVMPDHIGAELNFLALLLRTPDEGTAKRSDYPDVTERFVNEHLLKWVPRFTSDMEGASETILYKVLARTTRNLMDVISD